MKRERVERYTFESRHGVVRIAMRQVRNALILGAMSLVFLGVSWWYGPHGPEPHPDWANSGSFYWVFSGFLAFIVVASAVGAFYREDWTLRPGELRVTRTLGPWHGERRLSVGQPLLVRVAFTATSEGSVLPIAVRFADAQGRDCGRAIDLQTGPSLERCLKTLAAALPIEIDRPDRPAPRPSRTGAEEKALRAQFLRRSRILAAVALLVFATPMAIGFIDSRSLPPSWRWLKTLSFSLSGLVAMTVLVLPVAVWALRCPACGGWLGGAICNRCGRRFGTRG